MNLLRSAATIGGLTLVSRLLGFVRDMLMARFVGAGMAADAFLIAFRLPNLFRALFAEGAFSAAFVPIFSRTLGADGRHGPASRRFAADVLSILLPVLFLFTLLMVILAGPVVFAMTGGFPDASPGKFDLTVAFTQLTFPYLLLISLASLLGGVLNSLGRFAVNAAAPILLNLCLITALLVFRGTSEVETARAQAIAVTVSGLAQFVWLLYSTGRVGFRLILRPPRLTPEVRRLLRVVWPAALGAGAVQFNLFISTALAARFLPEGAVSYLYYADRLNQLPLGLIGIGVGTALLPTLSRLFGAGRGEEAIHSQNRALELVLVLTLPAAAALIVSAEPIIRALLEHGAFSRADSAGTAAALAAFSTGLPAYVLIKVLTPGFHARSDTRTPVRIALASMLANLAGNLLLLWSLGHVGLALSTAISAWVNAALLYVTLRRRGHFRVDERLKRASVRICAAAGLMALALLPLNRLVAPWLESGALGGTAGRAAALAVLVGGGGGLYLGLAFGLRVVTPGSLKAQLARRRA